MRIVVIGYIVRCPLGGLAWHHLQYVLGLSRLGHEVYFLEESGDSLDCCYDPARGSGGTDPSYGVGFAAESFAAVGLGDRWAYHDAHSGAWFGDWADRADEICGSADALFNFSVGNRLRDDLLAVPERIFIDTDPVFTQVANISHAACRTRMKQHTSFFTFAENIGLAGSQVPDDGVPWQPTRQPVVLDAWPVTPGDPAGKITSVMQWHSYAKARHDGRTFGMKSESFLPYMDLPRRTGERFELALGSPEAPRQKLTDLGWRVVDPRPPTRSLASYQAYLAASKAEFGVAKHGYVVSRSGWFSERSANYLASGRPVLVQDTGFSNWLKTGEGVVAFTSPEAAIAGLDRINADYDAHCQAAREVAATYFDSAKVLGELLERSRDAVRTCRAGAHAATPAAGGGA